MLKKRLLMIIGMLMIASLAVFAGNATDNNVGAGGFYESFLKFVTDRNVSMGIVLALFVMGFYRTVSGGTLMSIVFYWGLAFIFMNLQALTEAVAATI